jgi:sulfoxide reductase heme-binding subunit YedZ
MAVAAASFATNADWYLMRASGFVTLVLLTAVLVLGIATFRRWRPAQLPRFVTTSLHRSISLLAVVFLGLHVVTAIVDPYAVVGLTAAVVPFVAGRNPFWVGLGAISLDLVVALIASSLMRARVGARTWRAIHWFAYLCWPLALAHSFGTGTDASTVWMLATGLGCVAAVLAALLWRLAAPARGIKHLESSTRPA